LHKIVSAGKSVRIEFIGAFKYCVSREKTPSKYISFAVLPSELILRGAYNNESECLDFIV